MKHYQVFLLSIIATLLLLIGLNYNKKPKEYELISYNLPPPSILPNKIPTNGIILAHNLEKVDISSGIFTDTTLVLLLGGISCSAPQIKALQELGNYRGEFDLVALFVDPTRELAQNQFESMLLKRTSRADFPFLISTSPELDFRSDRFIPPALVMVVNNQIIGKRLLSSDFSREIPILD